MAHSGLANWRSTLTTCKIHEPMTVSTFGIPIDGRLNVNVILKMLGSAMPATMALFDIVATALREVSATASVSGTGSGTDSAGVTDPAFTTPADAASFLAFSFASFLRWDAAFFPSSSSVSSVPVLTSSLVLISSTTSVVVPRSVAAYPPSLFSAGIVTVLTFQTYAQSAAPTAILMTTKMTFDP